jgi:hypothetical protein
MGETNLAYKILVLKPEVMRPLDRPRRKWENNIKINLPYIGDVIA